MSSQWFERHVRSSILVSLLLVATVAPAMAMGDGLLLGANPGSVREQMQDTIEMAAWSAWPHQGALDKIFQESFGETIKAMGEGRFGAPTVTGAFDRFKSIVGRLDDEKLKGLVLYFLLTNVRMHREVRPLLKTKPEYAPQIQAHCMAVGQCLAIVTDEANRRDIRLF